MENDLSDALVVAPTSWLLGTLAEGSLAQTSFLALNYFTNALQITVTATDLVSGTNLIPANSYFLAPAAFDLPGASIRNVAVTLSIPLLTMPGAYSGTLSFACATATQQVLVSFSVTNLPPSDRRLVLLNPHGGDLLAGPADRSVATHGPKLAAPRHALLLLLHQ